MDIMINGGFFEVDEDEFYDGQTSDNGLKFNLIVRKYDYEIALEANDPEVHTLDQNQTIRLDGEFDFFASPDHIKSVAHIEDEMVVIRRLLEDNSTIPLCTYHFYVRGCRITWDCPRSTSRRTRFYKRIITDINELPYQCDYKLY